MATSNEPQHFHIGRVQNLTDGIFAVGMTLLVIDLRIAPGFDRTTLVQGLLQLTPNFYSYVVSFFLLALFWWMYHRMLDRVVRADGGFVWWNLFFLFTVTLVPFSAYLLGSFYGTVPATEIYCVNITVLAALMLGQWRHAMVHGLVNPELTQAERSEITGRLLGVVLAYLSTALIGVWQPYWFFLGFALVVPMMRGLAKRLVH
jgi:TMEM175 potassium channel family protein